jgi:hypothetical protein
VSGADQGVANMPLRLHLYLLRSLYAISGSPSFQSKSAYKEKVFETLPHPETVF